MERAGQTNVSLYPTDKAIVRAKATDEGLSFSKALQHIIREWSEVTMLLSITRAHKAGVITARETLDRLEILAEQE